MGAISTYTRELSPNLDFYGGLDLRYYIGEHNKTLTDLLGGSFYVDPDREDIAYQEGNDAYLNEKLSVGDVVTRGL